MTTLSPSDGLTVLINTFRVKPGRAPDLVNLLITATEKTVKHVPGFVSANLHVSLDGKQVVNYAQWQSKAQFEAAVQDPHFKEHMENVEELVESFEPVLYELRYSESNESVRD